jgi:hypothetical protein
VAQRVVAVQELLDPGGFPETQDHSPRIARETVVGRRGQITKMLVPLPVTRTHGGSQSVLLPALPERFFEALALVRLGQFQEESFLFRLDDRGDELRQPLSIVFGERGDPLFFRRLPGVLTRADSGEKEQGGEEERKNGSPHPVWSAWDSNPPVRTVIP